MKTYLLNFLLLVIIVINYSNAQTTPITNSVEGNYTLYKTNLYDHHLETIAQQSYDLNQKISNSTIKGEYQSISFDPTFLEQSLNSSTFTVLKNNKERLKILYNIDEDGNTHSCALRIRTSSINNLSNSEIEAILTSAMQHKFNLTNIPEGATSFYYTFAVSYVIK